MLRRRDLAQHFVVSAYLTAELGSLAADTAGVAKELMDAQGDSGSALRTLAADQAGIMFAGRVLSDAFPLRKLAETFSVTEYLPSVAGLPEGLSAETFQRDYAGGSSKRYAEPARGRFAHVCSRCRRTAVRPCRSLMPAAGGTQATDSGSGESGSTSRTGIVGVRLSKCSSQNAHEAAGCGGVTIRQAGCLACVRCRADGCRTVGTPRL